MQSINQKPVDIFPKNFAHMFTSLLVHILVKKKKNLKVAPELNIICGVLFINFVISGDFNTLYGKKVNAKKFASNF